MNWVKYAAQRYKTVIVSICKKDSVSVLLGMVEMYINREKYQ